MFPNLCQSFKLSRLLIICHHFVESVELVSVIFIYTPLDHLEQTDKWNNDEYQNCHAVNKDVNVGIV